MNTTKLRQIEKKIYDINWKIGIQENIRLTKTTNESSFWKTVETTNWKSSRRGKWQKNEIQPGEQNLS